MAVAAHELKITREEVHQWLSDYTGDPDKLHDYIEDKVAEKELPDTEVNIAARDDLEGDAIDVVDLIMMDIQSYGPFSE